jgi:tetratricopeptide (TPR) repeat protein
MADPPQDDATELVLIVQRDPVTALRRASALLEADVSPRERAVAQWARGMANRELGDLRAARVDLERAWEAATNLDDLALAGQIAITLSLVVAYQGELAGALQILDVSEPSLGDAARGHLRLQRGVILYEQGEFGAALREYEMALVLLTASGDLLGELRLHINTSALLSYVGRQHDARQHLDRAIELARQLDQPILEALAEDNLGHIHALRGDFPEAFESFERATHLFAAGGYGGPLSRSLKLDHARALLQANLLEEAREMADRAVEESERTEGELDLAESLLVAAEAHLAGGDVGGGIAAAERSVEQYTERDRPAWAALARSVLLRARAAQEPTLEPPTPPSWRCSVIGRRR